MSLSVDPRIGSELFGYRLDALLGRGGMGVVYKAYDPRLKRNVALKLIAPEFSEDAPFRERFLTETELAASLEHPNVVPIHDAGEVDGQLYIAMRYVEGGELKTLLEKEGELEPARAVAVCGQIAAALDAAHARGLVHRDVKPSNVLLDEDEHVYLADFGLSRRLTDLEGQPQDRLSVGTPAYVSPEQVERGSVDGRADQYALGCVLYECLTGEEPFRHDSELAVLWAHVQETPPTASGRASDLPSEIDNVIGKAMAKDPDDRYASCGELVVAVREALGLHRPIAIRDRKAPILTAIGVGVVAAAVLASVLLSQGGGPGKPSTKPTLTPKVDSLQRIDPKTNKLVATIATGAGADGVAAGAGAVFVASTGARTVSRINPDSNAIVKQVAAAGAPRSIALETIPGGLPVASVLWVVTLTPVTGKCAVSQLDSRTLSSLFTQSYNACGAVATGGGQTWFGGSSGLLIWLDPFTAEAIRTASAGITSDPEVSHGLAVGAGAVWLVSPFTEELLRFGRRGKKRAIWLGSGSFPSDVTVGEGSVWVTDSLRNTVVKVDPSRNTVVRTIPVDHDPIAVAVGAGAVWVANHTDGTLSRINPRSGRATHFKVGPNPEHIAVGEGAVWVTVHPS